jgi:hypothetical protein
VIQLILVSFKDSCGLTNNTVIYSRILNTKNNTVPTVCYNLNFKFWYNCT